MVSDDTDSHQSSPRDLSIRVKRRPMPRKGHRKSRNGCLTCKKRKVKCDELLPRCGICARLSLKCVFAVDKTASPNSSTSSCSDIVPTRIISTDPSWFNIIDTRFLQHFLFTAYPTLPLDGWTVWQGVSQMSHEYEFLVHAMLALGASHLNLLLDGGTYIEAAMHHRVTAIKGLNNFLSNAHLSLHNADAAFAATLILAFQSYQMEEGLVEFLTMIRGCHLVGVHALADFEHSLFRTFERENYVKSVGNLMEPSRAFLQFGPEMVRSFCDSAKKLAPFCTSVQDLEYLALLQRVATATLDDPLLGHREHTRLYDRLGSFTSDEFARFIDPHNYPARLLILHMLVLDHVMDASISEMGPKHTGSSIRHTFVYKHKILLAWAQGIADSLPAEYLPYSEWPMQFARRLNRSPQQLLGWSDADSASFEARVSEIMI